MDIHFKEKVVSLYMQQLNQFISGYQSNLHDLNESAANETKSTAGDKHETALAMLQIEQKNIRSRLEEVMKRKKLLEAAGNMKPAARVLNGSLVKTNQGYFFIAAALGKITVANETIMGISPSSPLGVKLIGLAVGDRFQLLNTNYILESIV